MGGYMDLKEIEHSLENCEFFRGLEKADIERITSLCKVEALEPGNYVFRQGDFGEYLYIIMEGHSKGRIFGP